ncbi:hypothetical protein Pma05_77860 [Plantactinospora mayteni]|uniref:Uncharacterized protein n=1 Tax=Plantactinospora mayteni TaxID=566021 RepID=A0ABQ4F2T4_9ACTN|nr:hypothetical protein Pma05_77860 [Plantactinospora mayteni]
MSCREAGVSVNVAAAARSPKRSTTATPTAVLGAADGEPEPDPVTPGPAATEQPARTAYNKTVIRAATGRRGQAVTVAVMHPAQPHGQTGGSH